MASSALAQPADFRQSREDEYMQIISRYNKEEQDRFPKMFLEIVEAFEEEKFADILGDLYMQLDMGSKWRGQFFTPYNVCVMMAKMSATNVQEEIDKSGYMSVCDPCCGGGAMLIGFAQHCMEQKVNYHNNVLFVGQDIDPIVARMCYIQMSLLGCPGYVVIGNSLTQPIVGNPLFPQTDKVNPDLPDADIWYTPFWFTEAWHYRRALYQVTSLVQSCVSSEKQDEPTPPVVPPVEPLSPPAKGILFDEETKKAAFQQMNLFEDSEDLDPNDIDELDG